MPSTNTSVVVNATEGALVNIMGGSVMFTNVSSGHNNNTVLSAGSSSLVVTNTAVTLEAGTGSDVGIGVTNSPGS
jgi:hypothetical protein